MEEKKVIGQEEEKLDAATLEGIHYKYKYHPEYKRCDIEFEIDEDCNQNILNLIKDLYEKSNISRIQLNSVENISQKQFIETVLANKPASNTNRPISVDLNIDEVKFRIKIKSNKKLAFNIARDFTQFLKDKYQDNQYVESIFYYDKPQPIDMVYVNLQIVKEGEQRIKENSKPQDDNRDSDIHWYENIYAAKKPIKLKNIFRIFNIEEKKRLLIEGRAGIGKSTLCQYITYCWSLPFQEKKSLWQNEFDFIFWIPLRGLDVADNDIIDILERVCFQTGITNKFTFQEKELLKNLIKEKKILWLLDGYDELYAPKGSYLKTLWEDLLKEGNVIITSRSGYWKSPSNWRRVEITGLGDKQIQKYIQRFYLVHDKGEMDYIENFKKLQSFIQKNNNVQGIIHVPINLELLCNVYEQKKLQVKSNLNSTEIYNEIIKCLYERHATHRRGKTAEEITTIVNIIESQDYTAVTLFMECLAYKGIENHKIIFQKEQLQSSLEILNNNCNIKEEFVLGDIIKQAKDLGLIKVKLDNQYESYYFIHLTFQEFFAASYWVKLFTSHIVKNQEIAKNYVVTNKFNPFFSIVWQFVAGLLERYPDKLEAFFGLLLDKPRDEIGIYEVGLFTRCLNECHVRITGNKIDDILNSLCLWFDLSLNEAQIHYGDIINYVKNLGIFTEEILKNNVQILNSLKIKKIILSYLQSNDEKVIDRTLTRLWRIGLGSDDVIEQLILLFGHKSQFIKRHVIDVLRQHERTINLNLKNRIRNILHIFKHNEDPNIKLASASTLLELGYGHEDCVKILFESLLELGAFRHVDEQLEMLEKNDTLNVDRFIHANNLRIGWSLFNFNLEGNILSAFNKYMASLYLNTESSIVLDHAYILGLLGYIITDSAYRKILKQFMLNLLSTYSYLKKDIAFIFGQWKEYYPEVLELLINFLQDDELALKAISAWAIGNLHIFEPKIIEVLVGQFKENDVKLKNAIKMSLEKLSETDAKSVDYIFDAYFLKNLLTKDDFIEIISCLPLSYSDTTNFRILNTLGELEASEEIINSVKLNMLYHPPKEWIDEMLINNPSNEEELHIEIAFLRELQIKDEELAEIAILKILNIIHTDNGEIKAEALNSLISLTLKFPQYGVLHALIALQDSNEQIKEYLYSYGNLSSINFTPYIDQFSLETLNKYDLSLLLRSTDNHTIFKYFVLTGNHELLNLFLEKISNTTVAITIENHNKLCFHYGKPIIIDFSLNMLKTLKKQFTEIRESFVDKSSHRYKMNFERFHRIEFNSNEFKLEPSYEKDIQRSIAQARESFSPIKSPLYQKNLMLFSKAAAELSKPGERLSYETVMQKLFSK